MDGAEIGIMTVAEIAMMTAVATEIATAATTTTVDKRKSAVREF
jgi:hypothetical protein